MMWSIIYDKALLVERPSNAQNFDIPEPTVIYMELGCKVLKNPKMAMLLIFPPFFSLKNSETHPLVCASKISLEISTKSIKPNNYLVVAKDRCPSCLISLQKGATDSLLNK